MKWSDLMGDTVEFLKNASRTMQNYYVERCQLVFIINAPYVFGFMWRIISPLLHENTRRKVQILGKDFKSALAKYISDDQIPSNYGGSGGILGSSIEELKFKSYVQNLNRNVSVSVKVDSPGNGELSFGCVSNIINLILILKLHRSQNSIDEKNRIQQKIKECRH